MDIATQIANILQANPDGLKASEIADQIGCTRKVVNSYLYAHKDMYEQHEGYIWTAKSVKRSAPPSPCANQTVPTGSCSVSIQQSMGNAFVSTLTITPNGAGYQISSTNNQIICCDCNKFISIHAPACPFCGCPLHYMADKYYKHYGAEAIRKAQQQQHGCKDGHCHAPKGGGNCERNLFGFRTVRITKKARHSESNLCRISGLGDYP